MPCSLMEIAFFMETTDMPYCTDDCQGYIKIKLPVLQVLH